MSEEDSAEKEFEATERKLDEQRRKGEVPRSTDINTSAAYLGLLIAAIALGEASITRVGELGAVLLQQADSLAELAAGGARPVIGTIITDAVFASLPLFALPFLLVWAVLFAQRGVIFAPEKLQPKISRISLISNAKNKFGRGGLFEFAKSTVKLAVISVVLWVFVLHELPDILHSLYLTPALATTELMQMVLRFLLLVFVLSMVIGAIDFFWQRAEHLRKNRMSHKEMRDEMKSAEGDPYAKQERTRRGREIATNQMLANVPQANVVIVNPEHYAVALKWSATDLGAPVCVAKGTDEIAARIRERAAQANVPLHRDPPTARALHASVEIGAEIAPDHYGAVAAAIRFAEAMRSKAAKGRWA
ncbi:EscU/YscU/HrcU family type III secretion system export apparatus switch protein [Roseinatronobacter sp.]|uniref:EscU/YscU/HrcU family type III secretion system export apparatus switch protein n=1 Tax=Roseinatronobacter sp. TaxID=1945755 RepID=UPI0025E2F2CE|nr:flagellar type III secretion system protein FlhB [Roseibaca sp.]